MPETLSQQNNKGTIWDFFGKNLFVQLASNLNGAFLVEPNQEYLQRYYDTIDEIDVQRFQKFIECWYVTMNTLPHPSTLETLNHHTGHYVFDQHKFTIQFQDLIQHLELLSNYFTTLSNYYIGIYTYASNLNNTDTSTSLSSRTTKQFHTLEYYIKWANHVLETNNSGFHKDVQYMELTDLFDWCYHNHAVLIPKSKRIQFTPKKRIKKLT